MVERLEHQLAARALARRRAERAVPVEDAGRDTLIVDPEPGAAGEHVEAGDTSGRSGQCRPGACHGRSIISSRLAPMITGQFARPAQDDERAHASRYGLIMANSKGEFTCRIRRTRKGL